MSSVNNLYTDLVINKKPAQFKEAVVSALQKKALNKITSQAQIIGQKMFKENK